MIGVREPMKGVIYPPRDVLERYVADGHLTESTVADALIEALPKFGDKVAITGPEGDVTYAELDDNTNRFAAALLDLGLRPLDRVVFQVANSKEVLAAVIACWKANLIPLCTLAAHRKNEIAFLAKHAGAKAHFIGIAENFDFPAFAEEIRAEAPSMEHIIVVRGEGPASLPHMKGMIAAQDADQARRRISEIGRDPYQVTAFQLSGGTTSIPKIIPRFGNEYLCNFECVANALGFTKDDTVFFPLQLTHNAGMIYNFPAFLCGATVAVSPKLDPPTLLGVLKENKPTIFALMASAVARMRAVNIKELVDFSHVKLVISPNVARQIEELLGVPSAHLFGMAEGMCAFGSPDDPEDARYNTIGRPISHADEIKILEPGTEKEMPKGEIGEMVTRGPYTIHGYYDAEDRDREAFTSDGFYRSGDLMSVRTVDGVDYYAFEGRLKDVVSRGGEKINCEEVEMAARKHPAIADIAIVAMPDPEYDERACAYIIPAPGGEAPDVETLMEFLVSEGLAKFKCPERIETVQEFPQTDSGKLSKPKLKEMIASKLAEEAA